jgi:aminopeptidase
MDNWGEQLNRYADLLVAHGMNVQPKQYVQVSGSVCHRELAYRIAEAAYRHGAKFVQLDLVDDRITALRTKMAADETLDFVPSFVPDKYRELLNEHAAVVSLVGPEDPDLYASLDASKLNRQQAARRRAIQFYFEQGIGRSKVHWLVAGAATPLWAKKIFPDLSPDAACARLWEAIFSICRVDTPDYLQRWQKHNRELQQRAHRLTELKIATLQFTGPGTDLRVGLTKKARWVGGSEKGPYGAHFEPNIPTEECFTTPDWRLTEGMARVTRPFFIYGQLVEGLQLEFRKGEISSFRASKGEAIFREYINSDAGACRLGEVALVGVDSPIYQSGLVFHEILYDENAACHIAVGNAYNFALEGGPQMSTEELTALGCNVSITHTDMMISSEEVDVTATTHDGREVPLLRQGAWVQF